MIDPTCWDRDAVEQELQRWTIDIDPAYLLRKVRLILDPEADDDRFDTALTARALSITMRGADPERPSLGHVTITIGKA